MFRHTQKLEKQKFLSSNIIYISFKKTKKRKSKRSCTLCNTNSLYLYFVSLLKSFIEEKIIEYTIKYTEKQCILKSSLSMQSLQGTINRSGGTEEWGEEIHPPSLCHILKSLLPLLQYQNIPFSSTPKIRLSSL